MSDHHNQQVDIFGFEWHYYTTIPKAALKIGTGIQVSWQQ